jgi:uncharacterized protein YlaI
MLNQTRNCSICDKQVKVEEIKYHTPLGKPPVYIFCGPECSLKYHEEKRNAS